MGSNGPAYGRRNIEIRMAIDAFWKAQAQADQLRCRAWNLIMADGGPAQPSPTIGQAIRGGYPWLRVKCAGCKQHAWVALAQVDRPASTPIWRLEGALACQPCRGNNVRAPRASLERLCRIEREFGWGNL